MKISLSLCLLFLNTIVVLGQLDSISKFAHTVSYLKNNFKLSGFNTECLSCRYDCDSVSKPSSRVYGSCEALLKLQEIQVLDSILMYKNKLVYDSIALQDYSLSIIFLSHANNWFKALDFDLKLLDNKTMKSRSGYLDEQITFVREAYINRLQQLRVLE